MSIETSLERIANALELIARIPAVPVACNTRMKEEAMPAQQASETRGLPEPKPNTFVTPAPGKTDREILMAQCDDLKLPYPQKASVKRLKEILETYGKQPKQAELPLAERRVASETVTTGTPSTVGVITKSYTQPEAKEILMRFAAKYGMDKAMKIITGFNVKDLSGVAAAGKLNELVEVTLKAEVDHGRK